LNESFYKLHAELWQPSPPPSIPEPGIFHLDPGAAGAPPAAGAGPAAATQQPGIFIANTATYKYADKFIRYDIKPGGV